MTQRILSLRCLALAALTLGVSPLAFSADDLLSVAGKKPELSTFVRLVQQAGLSSAVNAAGVTVFAPTDEAFKAVAADTLDKLTRDPEHLKAVLSYHVVPAKLPSSAIDGSTSIATLNGAKVNVSKAGDLVVVDDSVVTLADIAADNGVIHEIDRVLLPAVKK